MKIRKESYYAMPYIEEDEDELSLSEEMKDRLLRVARKYYYKYKEKGITKEDAIAYALDGYEDYIDDISQEDYCDLLYFLGD